MKDNANAGPDDVTPFFLPSTEEEAEVEGVIVVVLGLLCLACCLKCERQNPHAPLMMISPFLRVHSVRACQQTFARCPLPPRRKAINSRKPMTVDSSSIYSGTTDQNPVAQSPVSTSQSPAQPPSDYTPPQIGGESLSRWLRCHSAAIPIATC